MDLLVEKAVELGCAGLVPVECERCVRRVAGPRLARWRRIASEAMKQSRRAHLADVFEPLDFDEAAGMAGDFDLVLLASEAPAVRPLKEVARAGPAAVALWVGPEGGFTDPEVEALMSAGAETFSLGAYRLRSETAALAALAAVGVLVATNSL
jgi:16S rRNA (uracil1498-N3)-methyltransferase